MLARYFSRGTSSTGKLSTGIDGEGREEDAESSAEGRCREQLQQQNGPENDRAREGERQGGGPTGEGPSSPVPLLTASSPLACDTSPPPPQIFTNWINFILRQRGLQISSVLQDLDDGLILIQLAELLIGKNLAAYERNPRMMVGRIPLSSRHLICLSRLPEAPPSPCPLAPSPTSPAPPLLVGAEAVQHIDRAQVLLRQWSPVHRQPQGYDSHVFHIRGRPPLMPWRPSVGPVEQPSPAVTRRRFSVSSGSSSVSSSSKAPPNP